MSNTVRVSARNILGDISPEAPPVPAVPVAPPLVDAFDSEDPPALPTPIYGEFFGLAESPFSLTPDPRFLFLTPRMQEALSSIRYSLGQSLGFTVILGEAGTGKTTILRTAMDELPSATTRCVLLNNPALSRTEFYEFLTREFGFSPEAAVSKSTFLVELEQSLRERAASGGVTGLIVDEAQSLSHELLEEIRLLGNIETTNRKLLHIVLSGQPELADRLNEPALRQLKQRIGLRCQLGPLSADETAGYLSGRIRIAGGSPQKVFTKEAVIAAHRGSAGIPRSLNVICSNALLSSYAMQLRPVPQSVVADVCREFDFDDSSAPPTKESTVQPSSSVSDRKKGSFSFFS